VSTSKWKKWDTVTIELDGECPIDLKSLQDGIANVLKTSPTDPFEHNHAVKCKLFDVILEKCLLHTKNLVKNDKTFADNDHGFQGHSDLTPLAPIVEIKTEVVHTDLFQLFAMMKAAQFVNYTSLRFEANTIYGLLTDCNMWMFAKLVFDGLTVKSLEFSRRFLMEISGDLDPTVIGMLYQMCQKADDNIERHKQKPNTMGSLVSFEQCKSKDLCWWLSNKYPSIPGRAITKLRECDVSGRDMMDMNLDQLLKYGIPDVIANRLVSLLDCNNLVPEKGEITVQHDDQIIRFDKANYANWCEKDLNILMHTPISKGGAGVDASISVTSYMLSSVVADLTEYQGTKSTKTVFARKELEEVYKVPSIAAKNITRWVFSNLLTPASSRIDFNFANDM